MIDAKTLAAQLPIYLQAVEGRDVSGSFRCVLPSHTDNNPSMSLWDNGTRVRCFGGCTNSAGYPTFNIYDLIYSRTGINNFYDQMHIAKHLTMGADLPEHLISTVTALNINSAQVLPRQVQTKAKKRGKQHDYNSPEAIAKRKQYIADCQKHFDYHPYFATRGISPQTLAGLQVGYDSGYNIFDSEKKFMRSFPAAIFPMSNGSYSARMLGNVGSRFKSHGKGHKGVINEQALHSSDPIFIVEGPFDVASILEVESEAISTASTNAHTFLIKAVAKINPRATFIISFDCDPNTDTQSRILKNAHVLARQLKELGATVSIDPISTNHNDANDFLVADRAGFEARIQQMIAQYR